MIFVLDNITRVVPASMMRQDDDGGWEVYDPPNKQYYAAVTH